MNKKVVFKSNLLETAWYVLETALGWPDRILGKGLGWLKAWLGHQPAGGAENQCWWGHPGSAVALQWLGKAVVRELGCSQAGTSAAGFRSSLTVCMARHGSACIRQALCEWCRSGSSWMVKVPFKSNSHSKGDLSCRSLWKCFLTHSVQGHQKKQGHPRLHNLKAGSEPQQPDLCEEGCYQHPLQSPPASTLCQKGPGATVCGQLEKLIHLSLCSNNGNKKRTRWKTKINSFDTDNQLAVLYHHLKLCNCVGMISANTKDWSPI